MICECGKSLSYSGGCMGEWEHNGPCNPKSLEIKKLKDIPKLLWEHEIPPLLQRLKRYQKALEDIRDEQVLDGQGVVDLDNALTAAMRNIAREALE